MNSRTDVQNLKLLGELKAEYNKEVKDGNENKKNLQEIVRVYG
jgi:hypothetical protein